MDRSNNDLIYCGLGLYYNIATGQYYEKTASNKLCEINNKEIEAERRYVKRHLKEQNNKKEDYNRG